MASKMHTLNNVIYSDSIHGDIIKIFYVLDGIQYGVDSKANWFQLNDNDKEINRLDNNLIIEELDDSILTLLEANINNFKDILEQSLKSNNISNVSAVTFPYELVILNGLLSGSGWWVNLALDWFSNISINDNYNYEPMLSLIKEIVNNKSYDQKIRHKANKALVKYKSINDLHTP